MLANRSKHFVWALALLVFWIFADQVTKWMVLNEPVFNALGCLDGLERCGKIELSSAFDLSMLWNRGISFGLAQSEGLQRWILFLFQGAIAIGFFVWLLKAERRLTAFALALVVGGAIGNMIDRFRFGAVVDFFDFSGPWFGWQIPLPDALGFIERIFTHYPDGVLGIGFPYVFNVADAGVTVGAICLFADQFLISQDETKTGGS